MIGVLDWGIGGMGFYRAWKARHPRVPVVYWSDTGAVPYGKLPAAELAARVTRVAHAMKDEGVTHLVIACNAASTVLDRVRLPMPATGVIEHAIRMAKKSPARTLGVVGGRRTIRAGVYRRALAQAGRRVLQRVAQPLSALIEAGDLSSATLDREVARIVRPLAACDALLLACTHYPAIAPVFARHLPGVALLDPADALVAWVGAHFRPAPSGARDRFITTGNSNNMRRSAERAFAVRVPHVLTRRLASR